MLTGLLVDCSGRPAVEPNVATRTLENGDAETGTKNRYNTFKRNESDSNDEVVVVGRIKSRQYLRSISIHSPEAELVCGFNLGQM